MSSVYFKGHRGKTITGLTRRAPKGGPTRTPVVPHPESLAAAAQAAYTEAALIAQVWLTCRPES
jgi:hypothetical protein